jgi:hypothetical protein
VTANSVPTPIEIFGQVLLASQSGDVQALLDLCGRPAEVRGKEPLGRYLAAVPSARVQFDGLSNFETHQTVDPEVAVIEMTATGTVRTTRAGRITRYRDYWNPLKSLAAAS